MAFHYLRIDQDGVSTLRTELAAGEKFELDARDGTHLMRVDETTGITHVKDVKRIGDNP